MKANIYFSGDKLLNLIKQNIEKSDEIIILAALITDGGIQQILSELRKAKEKKKKIKFIFGIGMPTTSSPDAINKLFYLHDDDIFKLLYYNGQPFFHPKLFLFKNKNLWTAIIGSSNLTEPGILKNIEINCCITNLTPSNSNLKNLLNYIKEIETDSNIITQSWIEKYRENCDKSKIKSTFNNLVLQSKKVKSILEDKPIELKRWKILVNALKKYKNNERLKEFPKRVSEFKRTIGSFENPNVKKHLWKEGSIGALANYDDRNFSKTNPNTPRKLKKLNATLRFLFNKKLPLEDRLEETVPIQGKYHINGMGISFISDILIKYSPSEYFLCNGPIIEALKHYGIQHISSNPVQQYIAALQIYKRLRDEVRYPKQTGYILIDGFMWDKGHKLIYGWS